MKLLKFYADWCQPCKEQTRQLAGLENIVVESVDVDTEEAEELISKYDVKACPTTILVDDEGNVLERFNGLTQLDTINEALKKYE